MKKLLYTLLMILGLSVHAQDTNYIGPVDAHNTTWSNFYILDTERFFLNGQEIFGSTAGVFQIWAGGSNFYGNVYFSGGGVSVLNSTTIQFSAGQTVFTSAYSIAYSGATTNSLSTPLGASNTIAVSTGTNGGLAFVTGASLGFATGTPVYVETDPIWTSASTGYYTKIQSDGRFATGTPVYVETDPIFTNANFAGDVTGKWNNITIASYEANGSFSTRPVASGSDSVAIGFGAVAAGEQAYAGPGDRNKIYSDYCFILSGILNTITNSNPGETILGGQINSIISGGGDNFIFGGGPNTIRNGSFQSVIGGGGQNLISNGQYGVISGGFANSLLNNHYACFIGGGQNNTATNSNNSILGGSANTNYGLNATIVGGIENFVSGEYSLAAGYQADATNNSSFVWSDRGASRYGSHGTNTFNFRASGGVWHGDNQLLTGDGNILLARITNAANSVYATGTPLYAYTETDPVFTNAQHGGDVTGRYNAINIIGYDDNGSFSSPPSASGSNSVAIGYGSGVGSDFGVAIGGSGCSVDLEGVAGGVFAGQNNSVGGTNSVICGGNNNVIAAETYDSFIGGGGFNEAPAYSSAVIGGVSNTVDGGGFSFIGGGLRNFLQGSIFGSAIIAGKNNSFPAGSGNTTNTWGMIILGGVSNSASGNSSAIISGLGNVIQNATNSYALGTLAYATNNGSFVFSDFNTSTNYGSHGANTFNFRASGGVWHNDSQLSDGSANILLARITNAANGVYATGTPLYVETDNTILSNSTVVGSASKFNFVNPSALTIAGGTANVTMATSGSAAGNFTNHQPILEWYAPRDNTTNNNMLVSSVPAANYLSTYTATSIEECIMFWQTAATTSQDRQRAFSISMPVAFGTTTTNIQIKMRHNQSTNGIFVTQFFYNNQTIAFTNQITAANSTETKNMATAGTFLTNLPEGLKLYGNIIGTSQSTNTANQAQLGLMDFRIMR